MVTCPVPVEVSDALARLDGAHHVKMHFTNETNVLIYNIVIPLPGMNLRDMIIIASPMNAR